MPSEEQIDNLAREIYQRRSQSPVPMTDERWDRIKERFQGSVRICQDEAVRMYQDGEMG